MDNNLVCPDTKDVDQGRTELIDAIIRKYLHIPGSLIPALEEVQDVMGYLPESIQKRVADGLELPLSAVYGVVTFYSFFTMIPRGRHQIRVCTGTACHVRGSNPLLAMIEDELNLKPGGITDDHKFSLDTVRCLGCCALAPVMMIDNQVYQQVTTSKLRNVISSID